MERFPYEIQVLIWEMDHEKREKFNRVAHQLKMRSVFWEWNHCHCHDSWLHMIPMPIYDRDNGRMEAMVEAMMRERFLRHRVLGRRPRFPVDEFDLMAGRTALTSPILPIQHATEPTIL